MHKDSFTTQSHFRVFPYLQAFLSNLFMFAKVGLLDIKTNQGGWLHQTWIKFFKSYACEVKKHGHMVYCIKMLYFIMITEIMSVNFTL